MPGLEGGAQLHFDAAHGVVAVLGKAEFKVRRKPAAIESVACLIELRHDIFEVLPDEVGQEKAIMQLRAPAHQTLRLIGCFPKTRDQRAQEQLLGEAHARVRRHLEGAHLKQPQTPGGAVRRVKFVDAKFGAVGVAGDVDQQIAQQPVDQPGRAAVLIRIGAPLHFAKGHFNFAHRIVARFVDARRLRGRTDEKTVE